MVDNMKDVSFLNCTSKQKLILIFVNNWKIYVVFFLQN